MSFEADCKSNVNWSITASSWSRHAFFQSNLSLLPLSVPSPQRERVSGSVPHAGGSDLSGIESNTLFANC